MEHVKYSFRLRRSAPTGTNENSGSSWRLLLRVAVRGLGAVVVKLRTRPLVSSRVITCPRGISVHLHDQAIQ